MIKKYHIMCGTSKIEFSILYSKRKTATISVYPYKDVEIIVPQNTTSEETKKIIKKKVAWIIKKIDFFNQISKYNATKEYINGETILYLGRQYRIEIIKSKNKPNVKLKGRYLEIELNKNFRTKSEQRKYIKTLVIDWYRKQAKKNIKKALIIYSKKLGVEILKFKIKNQIKKWGSCTPKNTLNFNLRIIMASKYQFDYVIVHELCHIKIKNHSAKFWKLVESILNDYELRKTQLRENGNMYDF